jgi:hypothetical protein
MQLVSKIVIDPFDYAINHFDQAYLVSPIDWI